MESSAKTRLPLQTLAVSSTLSVVTPLSIGIILHSYLLIPMGRKFERAPTLSVFGD
jgi:ACR3 family arsenite efflux pump ArsB